MVALAPCYLKLNRRSTVTTRCLQFWSDVWGRADAQVFLLCDWDAADIATWVPPELRDRVVVPSSAAAYDLVRDRVWPKWRKAGAAHMTTFEHAAAAGLDAFWNVDGDDTIFLHDPAYVAGKLVEVQQWSRENAVDCASLDFYQTYHGQWSFGVTFTRMTRDYPALLAEIDGEQVLERVRHEQAEWARGGSRRKQAVPDVHVDRLFSHLRDTGAMNAASFYFEDSYFLHAGIVEWHIARNDAVGETLRGLYHWRGGLLWADPIDPLCVRL